MKKSTKIIIHIFACVALGIGLHMAGASSLKTQPIPEPSPEEINGWI